MRLLNIGLSWLKDIFPDDDSYPGSRWASWEERIEKGHKAEERIINKIYKERLRQENNHPYYIEPAELAADDYWRTCRLTNAMYASVVVSVWAEMELFLKYLIGLCRQIRGKKQAKLYVFKKIKEAFKKDVDIDIGRCTEYNTVNAIRILNNCFKHSQGKYNPLKDKKAEQKKKEPETIEETLLHRWQILDEGGGIDYSKLSIQELVISCNAFYSDLIAKARKALK